MFLKISVYLPHNDELFKAKPVIKYLQDKFHLMVDNCHQF